MADKEISALPAAPSMGDDALLVIQQGGVAQKLTAAQLLEALYKVNASSPVKIIDLTDVGDLDNVNFSQYQPGDVILVVQSG